MLSVPWGLRGRCQYPLQTKTIPAEIVRQSLAEWTPSMQEEYDSLVVSTSAVSPLSDLEYSRLVLCLRGRPLREGSRPTLLGTGTSRHLPHLRKQMSMRQEHPVKASGSSYAALDKGWVLRSVDVKTAFFLNTPVVTPNDTTIIVRVPAILSAAGVCQESTGA